MKLRLPSRKSLMISVAICFSVAIIGAGYIAIRNIELLDRLKRFSVTIDNQSDYDLVYVETGIRTSKESENNKSDVYHNVITSGSKKRVKPDLTLTGEGSIYLKFNNSDGKTYTKTICSYTEYVSGSSEVMITNESISVEEDCY